MPQEKITESLKLHLGEGMKRDLQDAAMREDRKVSDYVRHVLALHLYGICGLADHETPGNGAMWGDEGSNA
jgi:hypothetical protein